MHGSLTTTAVFRAALALGSACLMAGLGGCQAARFTQVTVMNESTTPLVLDIAMADSEAFVQRGVTLDMGGVREFRVDQADAGVPVQVGVRPADFEEAAAQWLEFASADGPYLLRVQGSATGLRFVPSRDEADIRAQDIRPAHPGRLGAEPPVNPR